jgi:Amt family ammonium transporter
MQANDFPGHNSSLFVLGVMILWFGWYGFNPGSQLNLVGLQNSFAVSNAAVTTTLAPAAAGLSALVCQALITHFTTGVRARCLRHSPPLCCSVPTLAQSVLRSVCCPE